MKPVEEINTEDWRFLVLYCKFIFNRFAETFFLTFYLFIHLFILNSNAHLGCHNASRAYILVNTANRKMKLLTASANFVPLYLRVVGSGDGAW